jgi:hypothetical protein
MATSGNFVTSDSGQGDAFYYSRMIFEWWQVSSGISGAVGYHGINYHLKTYGGQTPYWQYFYQGSMNVDGAGYSWGTTQAYSGGATVFGDYGNTLYTNSVGDRSFGASAQGGVFYNTINTSGSGSWALDHINLWGGVTSISVPSPLTDESGAITVDWFHYTGTGHIWYRLDLIDNADSTYHYSGMADPHTFSGYGAWLKTKMANTNTSTLYIYYGDDIDNNGSVDNWQGPWTYAVSIANGTGQANPTFTTFTYLDTNSTTTAVTGNNQVLIQGKSTLAATVSVANKATANKSATMSTYNFTIGGYSQSSAWSNVADVVKTIGVVSDVTGAQNLSVKAIDSRTNFKTVTQSVTILPYASPAFLPALTVKYANGFDNSSGLTVTGSGTTIATISPMTLAGTDKNAVNTTTGVQFDVSKGNNTSYTGTYVNVTTARATNASAITTTLATLASSILTKMNGLTADNTVKWYIKFKIVDALETQYFETFIDIGKPIFRIGTDGNVYNNEVKILNANDILYAYAYGDIGAELTANTYHTLGVVASSNITMTSTTATIVTPGLYVVHAQQLISCTGAVNYSIQKNNAVVAKGWVNNLQTDALASCIVSLTTGDTIRVHHDTALAAAWQALHSSWYIYLLKKT